MAIIKCSTCKMNVPDDTKMCPNCGNDLDKVAYCPKCGSADTSVLLKWKNGEAKRYFIANIVRAFFGWRMARAAYNEAEYASSLKRICNDCGKKFRIK